MEIGPIKSISRPSVHTVERDGGLLAGVLGGVWWCGVYRANLLQKILATRRMLGFYGNSAAAAATAVAAATSAAAAAATTNDDAVASAVLLLLMMMLLLLLLAAWARNSVTTRSHRCISDYRSQELLTGNS